jgi:Sulfatase
VTIGRRTTHHRLTVLVIFRGLLGPWANPRRRGTVEGPLHPGLHRPADRQPAAAESARRHRASTRLRPRERACSTSTSRRSARRSRSAILTGRFAIQFGTHSVPMGGGRDGLTQWEVTLADLLSGAGYALGADGTPVLVKEPKVEVVDDGPGNGGYQPVHWAAAHTCVRQLRRRPADARVDRGRYRSTVRGPGPSHRFDAGMVVRPAVARRKGGQGAGRSYGEEVDRGRYEGRLEGHVAVSEASSVRSQVPRKSSTRRYSMTAPEPSSRTGSEADTDDGCTERFLEGDSDDPNSSPAGAKAVTVTADCFPDATPAE